MPHELRVFVRPEFHVSVINGNRVMRFEWNVANVGDSDFVGPHLDVDAAHFTTHYGRLALDDAWSITLFNEVTGYSFDFVGPAFLVWDWKTLTASPAHFRDWFRNRQTGISSLAEVFAPGFLTGLPLQELPDGDYLALFSFDPLDKWGGLTYTDFRVRIEKLSAVPI